MAMIRIIPIFLPVLVVGLGVLALFFIALFKSGPVGRWFFTISGVFLLLFLGSVFMLRASHVPVVRPHISGIELPPAVSPSSMEDNLVWQDTLEEELVPDTYSTLDRAAYGLGMQIDETIEEAIDRPPAKIRIREISSFDKSVLNKFRDGLHMQFEQAEITFGPRWQEPLPGDTVMISLEKREDNDHPLRLRSQLSENHSQETSFLSGSVTGQLEATVESNKGKFFKTVSYDTRSWLWNFDSFQSKAGSGHIFLVSVSDETATSRDQARDQALDKAVADISKQIWNTNPASNGSVLVTRQDLLQRGFIVDEYSQKLAGMAGPIWRHAILLDVSPDRLHSLISAKTEVVRVQRDTWLRLFVSLGGMILLVCVVYAIANAATKGYYSTVLAVSAVTAAVILGLIILNYA